MLCITATRRRVPARKRDTRGNEVCGSLFNIHWLSTQILFRVVIRREEGMGKREREGTNVNQTSVPGLCLV